MAARALGDDLLALLDDVVQVDLNDSIATDATLACVGRLTKLESLWLENSHMHSSPGGTRITDAGLLHIAGLTDLQELNLACTDFTDAGLLFLGRLTRLEYLVLGGTQISDAGLVHIAGLSDLQDLNLTGTDVTDAGLLLNLGQLTRLEILILVTPEFRTREWHT